MEIIFENQHARVSFAKKKIGSTTCICFTGIGHALGGIDIQKNEFAGLGDNVESIFFVIDKGRTWGNNLDFNFISDLILKHASGQKIITLGNSMGGFLSIVATKYFPVDISISFCPQFSILKELVPEETRWAKYISNIKTVKHKSVKDYFNNKCKYYVFHGDNNMDKFHSQRFPILENINRFELKDVDHNIAHNLKKNRLLYPVIYECFNGRDPSEILCMYYKYNLY